MPWPSWLTADAATASSTSSTPATASPGPMRSSMRSVWRAVVEVLGTGGAPRREAGARELGRER